MASRKMTFTLPEPLAARFLDRVPPRERSSYVAKALTHVLEERERRLIAACDAANADADIVTLERDLDAIPSEMREAWSAAK